jgi:hypothetical protein
MYSRPRTPSFTQPQTPPKASRTLQHNKIVKFPAHFSEFDEDSSDDDKVTPKAHTSHVPMGARPIQPSMVPEDLMLTNRPKLRIAQVDAGRPGSGGNFGSPSQRSVEGDKDANGIRSVGSRPTTPKTPRSSLSRSNSSRYSSTASPSSSTENSTLVITFDPTSITDIIFIPKNHNVEFHVNSSVISAASPVLADVIKEVFQSENGAQHGVEPIQSPIHVHKLDEKSEILDAVLRFCYPQKSKPKVRSITHLDRLLAACQRYQLSNGIHHLKIIIIQFASMAAAGKILGSPLECYGIACRFGFDDVAKLVSKYCLLVDIGKVDLGHALLGVDAKDTKRFFEFHNWRVCAAIKIIVTAVDAQELWCDGCSGLAEWYSVFVDKASCALTAAPVSMTIFSPSFITGCLKVAMKKCPYCIDHYLATKTQIRLAILQKDIDTLKDMV